MQGSIMLTNDQISRSAPDLQGRNRAGATHVVSPVRHINVLKPANGDARLPRPVITDADGNKLDLSSFSGNTTITCMPWALIAVGQKVWLAADGTLANGDPTTLSLWAASGVNASEVRNGLSKSLPRSWLESLRDGSTITVRLNVTFDGATERSRSVEFRLLELNLHLAPAFYIDPASMILSVGGSRQRQATGGVPPYNYLSSNASIATVSATGGQVTAVSQGSSTITARDSASGSGSYSVQVEAPWLDDLTTFAGPSYQGWSPGPGARGGGPVYMQDGGTAFFNNTNDDGNFAGMVISKTFAVTYGATYAVVARGEGGDINPASISVYANGRGIIAFFSVKGIVSIGPALVVANATSLTIEFYNSVATGLGNDFALRNIRVWRTA
jgi:hypothetical protein